MATDNLKKLLPLFIALLFLASCFSRPSMMTYATYDEVKIGTPIAEVQSQIGQPYAIHHKDSGDEYEYVERINVEKAGSQKIIIS